jgi:hypothetical protein
LWRAHFTSLKGLGFRVWGLGFKVQFRVWGLGFKVQGSRLGVCG